MTSPAPDVLVRQFQSAADGLVAAIGEVTSRIKAGAQVAKADAQVAKVDLQGLKVDATLKKIDVDGKKVVDTFKKIGNAAIVAATRIMNTAAAQRIAAFATRAWAVAQRVLNVVLGNNPIGWVIRIVALLVAGFVVAYQRSTTFRNIVNAVFTSVRNVVVGAINVIRNVVAVVWPFIVKVIQIAVTVIRAYITTYFTIIRTIITVVWNVIRAVITTAWQIIVTVVRTYISIVRTVITTVFNAVRTVVQTVWDWIKRIISGAVSTVVSTIRGIRQVFTIIKDAFGRALSAVRDAISGVIDFVRRLPGRVVSALGNIGRTLYQSGRDLISGFINGLRDMAGSIVSAIKDFVLDKIPGPIKRFLGISSPSRLMADIGRTIGEGLAVGIEDSGELVADAMENLVPTPKATVIRPMVAALAQTAVAGALPNRPAVGAGRTGSGAAPVTVNVYPQPGQSEYEIGRIAAREVAWAGKL